MQNITAVAIVLMGALIGSFFVDVVQFVRGDGFSSHAVRSTSIISYDGRTWVAYKEPIVPVALLADLSCHECQSDAQKLVTWLQYTIPTIRTKIIDYSSAEGQELMERYDIVQVPSALFDASVQHTTFFQKTQKIFINRGDKYLFDLPLLSIIPTRYIRAPRDGEVIHNYLGDSSDKVRITMMGNFDCDKCREVHSELQDVVNSLDDVNYTFAFMSYDKNERDMRALVALDCAAQQDALVAYITQMFMSHRWQASSNNNVFVHLAKRIGISDVTRFTECVADNDMDSYTGELEKFGTPELPLIFVDDVLVENIDDVWAILRAQK